MQHTRDIKGLQGWSWKEGKEKRRKENIIVIVWVYGVWYRVEGWTV